MFKSFVLNRNVQVCFVIALFVVALILLLLSSGEKKEAPTPIEQGLAISLSVGDVLISKDGKTWNSTDSYTLLVSGDRVRTGSDSRAKLLSPQGSVIGLDENTEIMVSQVDLRDVLLIQYSGETYHKVNTGQQGIYQVRAMNHTIKATGTAFDIAVNRKANRINTKVLEGKVSVAINFDDVFKTESIESGREATVDPNHEDLITFADITDEYRQSEWYRWNNNMIGDEDSADEESTKESKDEQSSAPAKTTPAKTTTPTVNTTTTKTTSVPTSGCKPYLTAKKDNTYKGILLNWTPCKNSDFQFYKVVRSTLNPNPTYPNDPVVSSSSNQSYSNFIDKTVAVNRTYYYRVCVVQRLNKTTCGNKVSVAY